MRVELLVDRVGPLGIQNAGDRIEVSDDEGLRMVKAGQARPASLIERAVPRARAEKAAK